MNDLRGRIRVETDGQLKTGRDVAIAALLGAEEFGFATRGAGRVGLHHDARLPPQHLPGRHRDAGPGAAQEVRGQARARRQLHDVHRRGAARDHGRARLPHGRRDGRPRRPARRARGRSSTGRRAGSTSPQILHKPEVPPTTSRSTASTTQDHGLERRARQPAHRACRAGARARHAGRDRAADPQRQPHRRHDAVGGDLAPLRRARACRPRRSRINFTGSAGQSFGAFLANGIAVTLEGDANDYFGKGLSGGRIVVVPAARPRPSCPRRTSSSATSRSTARPAARSSCRGMAGERFCVRNSGVDRGRRRRRRSRLRVHDRGPGRRARQDRPQLRRRHERRRRLRARRGRRLRETRCNLGMVELEPLEERDVETAARPDPPPLRATPRARVAWRILSGWKELRRASSCKVMPVEYRQVLAEAAPRHRRGEAREHLSHDERDRAEARVVTDPMGKITGFLEIRPRRCRRGGRSRSACSDWRELEGKLPEDELQAAGRALHGLRHSLLPQGLPAREHHPRLERPGLPRPLAGGDRPAARDQQLPGVHRPRLPGAVRRGLRPRHQRRPGHHQADREADRRPRLRGGLGRAAACRAQRTGKTRRGRRLGPGRPGRARSSSTRAGHRVDGLRARRPHRRPAALRHPRLQAGEAPRRPPHASRWRPRA